MQAHEAIKNRETLYGKVVSLTGVLYLDRESQYIVSNTADLGHKRKGIQILDQGLEKLLFEKVPYWLGGALYQDYVDVTGEIAKSDSADFDLSIRSLSRLRLCRDGNYYEVLG